MSRIFLANVGANASHRVRSPLFADGSFEFVTIPEAPGVAAPPMRRYCDLPCFNDPARPLTDYLPRSAWDQYTHADPEFATFTYGDNCERSPRAAALRSLRPGDLLFFLARLTPWADGAFCGTPGFFLVGYLEIAAAVGPVTARPAPDTLARLANNAHVRRGLADPAAFDGFWVFAGGERSARLPRAVPVTRAFADACLRDAAGAPWVWDGRSEAQIIGSYTRSCRCVIGADDPDGTERWAAWWDHVLRVSPQLFPAARPINDNRHKVVEVARMLC